MKTVNDLPLMVPETSGLKSVDIINSGVITADAAYEAQASIVRNSIPSGFVTLGELDYDYMSNNENKVKLKTESVAYVNGYEIRIPKGTIIDIGRAPEKESREDLLFLEVWKSEPKKENHVSAVTGTHYELTDNSVKVEWRIRHVAGVDFNVTPEGFPIDFDFGYANRYTHIFATPQGGNISPVNVSLLNQKIRMFSKANSTQRVTNNFNPSTSTDSDIGLYIAGAKSEGQYLKPVFKTLDGYVYAIPMFRLYRKPSCGKSIPFEYSKINPKVDYSKFAKLMKEEKVERVVTENIKGRSLVNLVNFSSFDSMYSYNTSNNILTLPSTDGSSWLTHKTRILAKPSTLYTLVLGVLDSNVLYEIKTCLSNSVKDTISAGTNLTVGTHIKSFTTPESFDSISIKLMDTQGSTSGKRVQLMILEGNWTNREIPEFFTGLKSLGEDDGNLVTVKNGILNDNTYDINDGNQKLTTFPQVTHILSENTIIPEIQANVKKDGGVTKSLDKLGTKLTTDGTEEIEFTSIKGRTIQNCYPKMTESSFYDLSGSIENGYIVLQGGETYKNASIPWAKCLIKPNTTYTMLVNVNVNTLTKDFILASNNSTDVFKRSVAKVPKGKTGTQRFLVISAEQLDSTMYGLCAFLSENETGKIKFNIMLLEGNFTTTPIDELPFVDGIKSVGETEGNIVTLSSCGKNLFDDSWLIEGKDINDGNGTITNHTNHTISKYFYLPKNKKFIIRGKQPLQYCILHFYRNDIWLGKQLVYLMSNVLDTGLFDYTDLRIEMDGMGYSDIQIEEGTVATEYEPYTGYTQQVYLKEPLRSLPSGVKDEIVGNKVIRKVGKVILNGSEKWRISSVAEQSNEMAFAIDDHLALISAKLPSTNTTLPNLICDTLPRREDAYNGTAGECIAFAPANILFVRVSKSKFSPQTLDGFKTWLSKNPVSVLYELANPIEEYLENVYEKESIKTYQLDAPLRSLPSGIKDEIKDGVLIRRCGEVNTSMNKSTISSYIDTYIPKGYFSFYIRDFIKLGKNLESVDYISDKLSSYSLVSMNASPKEGVSVYTDNVHKGSIFISLKLSTLNALGESNPSTLLAKATEWLSKNNLKIIYKLETPIEIPLTEVIPQNANFSLQRQFAEGNWLRELPNGVKDTIENGKVKRRIEKIVLDGSETWITSSNTSNDYSTFYTTTKTINSEYAICSNNFSYDFITSVSEMKSAEGIYAWRDSYNVEVRILTNKLTQNTKEGFKTWLSQNPITVLYELKTVKEETLTTENCNYYPCHDLNTYCGSMYVGEGRNYILSDNKMPSETPVIVETDFRDIDGKAKVEDCGYKKCDDGVNVAFVDSKSKNLIDPMKFAKHVLKCDSSATLIGNELTFSIPAFTQWSNVFPIHGYYKNTQLTCSVMAKRVSGNSGWYFGFVYDDNSYTFDSKTTNMNEYMLFKTTSNPVKNLKGLGMSYGMEGRYTLDLNTLQIELGSTATSHEPFKPKPKYLGTTGENDIEDLRHQVSLTGFNYDKLLNESFDKLLRGEL